MVLLRLNEIQALSQVHFIVMKENVNNTKYKYEQIKQSGLDFLNITPDDIFPLIQKLFSDQDKNSKFYDIAQVGNSFQKKPIYKITSGNGPVNLFLWSQMHGNESTATASLFDLINYIRHPENKDWFDSWSEKLTLHIVPMLNPDGAKLVQRVNAQGIDINRDAKALQSPEGRLLLSLAEEIKPQFGFNLHSQNRFYTVGETSNSAIISLLAPAYNDAKETNESRKKAKQLVSIINKAIHQQYPNHVGRYDDTYSYRSFGDLFSAKGISTILIEAGFCKNDQQRQIPRWLTFLGLIESITAIRDKSYSKEPLATELLDDYDTIPFNTEDGQADLLLKNISIDHSYCVDISINYDDEYKNGKIDAIGDLSTITGLSTIDTQQSKVHALKSFELKDAFNLSDDKYAELLKQGVGYFIGDSSLLTIDTELPVIVNPGTDNISNWSKPEKLANFILSQNEKKNLAIINGVAIKL